MLDIQAPEQYVGRSLYVCPGYGWGWHRLDGGRAIVDYAQVDQAGNFRILVQEFFRWKSELRGVIGVIEQEGHPFHGLWLVGATMLKGAWNLTDQPCCRYDLEIGPAPPVRKGPGWPHIAGGAPVYHGYGVIAETVQHIEAARARSNGGSTKSA